LGSLYFNYGNEVPALTKVSPGESVTMSHSVALTQPFSEINVVELGFQGIFEGASQIESRAADLPVVSGWWQTNDTEIADFFFGWFIYQQLTIPILPV
jgi:hypothetical protein